MELLSPVSGKAPLRIAFGVAAPALEAWLLAHRRQNVNETTWKNGLRENKHPYSKRELKLWLCGVDRPTLALETAKMTEAAKELASQIHFLEKQFPTGFKALADGLRSWRDLRQ